jgi:ABC-type dipeptide/oligopeptide/nickel transport system ATPase subunit
MLPVFKVDGANYRDSRSSCRTAYPVKRNKQSLPNGVQALQNIDLTLYQGEIFGIIGRSGAGNRRCCACLIAWKTPTAAKSPFTANRHCAIHAARCATCAAGWR